MGACPSRVAQLLKLIAALLIAVQLDFYGVLAFLSQHLLKTQLGQYNVIKRNVAGSDVGTEN